MTGKYFIKFRVFLLQLSLSIMVICFLQPFLMNPKVIKILLCSASSSLSSTNQVLSHRSHTLGLSLLFLLAHRFSACNWLLSVLNYVAKSYVAQSCMWYLSGGLGKTGMLEGLFFVSLLCFHINHLAPLVVFPPAQFARGHNCHASAEQLLGQLANVLYCCRLLFLPPIAPWACKLLECRVPSYPFVGDNFSKPLRDVKNKLW